jgi:hypothetical protein
MPDRRSEPTPSRYLTRLGVVQASREETAGPEVTRFQFVRLWGFEIARCVKGTYTAYVMSFFGAEPCVLSLQMLQMLGAWRATFTGQTREGQASPN